MLMDMFVTVCVMWMNEVSKIEVVVSMVLVTMTWTCSVTKTVIAFVKVAVAVTVMVLAPFGTRGARVMAGRARDAIAGCELE